ncbi:MAG: hypothetical protein HUJ74_04190 [Lachnospiraceae bacterium]|nr:hypothetical protein [Lachnospiraceae bacterium]
MDIKVAPRLCGCVLNGLSKARAADIGHYRGQGGLLFKKGEIAKKVPESELRDKLLYRKG